MSVFMERSLADLEDMEGRTPLMWAAATGNLANLPFLSRHGGGLNLPTWNIFKQEKKIKIEPTYVLKSRV
jgi:hypothetical protein